MKSAMYSSHHPPVIIDKLSLLLGKELEYIEKGFIEVGKGVIKRTGAGSYISNATGKRRSNAIIMDGSGLLAIPGFINAHTHIADSIGKDIAADSGLDERVHPVFGAKKKILEKSKPEHLASFIRNSAISMMSKGITTFADFREGGKDGVRLLQQATAELPIKSIVLGRIDQYFPDPSGDGAISKDKLDHAREVMQKGDGLGISGANENTDESLRQYAKLGQKTKKLIAIHAAESKNTVEFSMAKTGRTEISRAIQFLNPDIMIHMTNATDSDIEKVSDSGVGIVVCPRANGVLGAGIPRIAKMLEEKCAVAIGTDNVMLNSPDIFREMDYLWKASRAVEGNFISPKEILKMATVNAAAMLRLNSGCIEDGRAADLLFIDKNHIDIYPSHNPYASIVHRAGQESIRAIMIDGKFIDLAMTDGTVEEKRGKTESGWKKKRRQ